jgi:hypothetical protein
MPSPNGISISLVSTIAALCFRVRSEVREG